MAKKSANRRGIQSRLIRVFAVQAAIVSLATALGVYAAYKIAEDVLVKQALAGEAEHYWRLVDQQGEYALPNTNNMRGYMASIDDTSGLPLPLQKLGPGYGPVDFGTRKPLVYVSERERQRLYLLFKEEQVSNLALFFGVAPLTMVLILIYMASWFTFRQSQRVISPVVKLAGVVENADVRSSDTMARELAPFHAIDADIDALATALEHFAVRLEAFVDRERSFTRDASHELRTPLAVIKGSVDVLAQQERFSRSGTVVLQRIRATVQDMEGLIDTLLFLAREEIAVAAEDKTPVNLAPAARNGQYRTIQADSIVVNDLLPDIAQQVQKALGLENPEIVINQQSFLEVKSPQKVLNILFTNLLRNAFVHGKSAVEVTINDDQVTVKDQGPGMDREQMQQLFQPFYRAGRGGDGHGLGLTIVKRLCDRFYWELKVYSAPGAGTSVTIKFPE